MMLHRWFPSLPITTGTRQQLFEHGRIVIMEGGYRERRRISKLPTNIIGLGIIRFQLHL